MTLHVILPVHNRMQVTARFVEALARQTHTDYCLVLVDDGCTDETVAMVRRGVPVQRLTVLEGDGQLWWAGALQRAYEHLGSQPADDQDTVLIINDDVTFEADFLSRGLAVLAAHPHACSRPSASTGAAVPSTAAPSSTCRACTFALRCRASCRIAWPREAC